MNTDDLPVLELNGPPRERGRAHGESLRGTIRELMDRHRAFLNAYFGVDPADYLARFAAYADFGAAIDRWAPDLLDEVRGLAEGAGVAFEAMLANQLIDEEWAFGFYHARPAVPRNKCTAFASAPSPGVPALAGQNMDVPRYIDGGQVLLRVTGPGSDLTACVFTYAGLIGLCGMSSAPLGLTCNTLNQLRPSPRGLPVAFVVRRVLGCRSVSEAAAFLQSVEHASGQNYIVSGPGGGLCFECSSGKVTPYLGDSDGRRLFHTNHALANDDRGDFDALMRTLPAGEQVHFTNSMARYESVRRRLGDPGQPAGLAQAQAALSAHDDPANPVSRTYDDTQGSYIGFTAGSLIYDFGSPARLRLAAGPPCRTAYRVFDLGGAR